MKPFFNVQRLDQVHRYAEAVTPLGPEHVAITKAHGRTLAKDVQAPGDLPGFHRATMDGFAVRGRDTFGVSEGAPGYLQLLGEIQMGEVPRLTVAPGQCARISTGGMMPKGADAVVMVEHTRLLEDGTVEVAKPVAPGTHVLGPRDDATAGQTLLPAGQRLRPQDLGLLAALGQDQVAVIKRPRVGILSTGDEVIPITDEPRPGQVRDVNTYTLMAQVADAGGAPVPFGLVRDDESAMKRAVTTVLEQCQLLLLSGGSSMGARDLTADVFLGFKDARLLVHGVSVAPGKPFIWVTTESHQLLGLPGQVASCMIAFHLFAEPILERMLGRPARAFTRFGRRDAVLTRGVPSVPGREEYLRVRLNTDQEPPLAEPVFGKSGLIRTLTQGHGLVRIPANSEGLDEGAAISVLLFP